MIKRILLLSTACFLYVATAFTQNYQAAESVEYDPVNKQWLVSNGLRIIADDGYGNLSFFGTGSGAFGMEVLGNTAFAITNTGAVKGYDLTTQQEVASINIPGATFLNGMTNDGVSKLYVTDFSAQKIHSIDVSDLSNLSSQEIVSSTGSTPNGIVYDGDNNRLIFVNWNGNAPIKAVDLTDNSVSTILTTSLGSIDGIDENNDGDYYLASWSPNQISKYDKDFANPLEVITTPFLNNPADIGYSLENDTLAIPVGNNVIFVGFAPPPDTTTSSLDLVPKNLNFQVYPNPVTDQSYIQFDLDKSEALDLVILDQQGKMVQTLLEGQQTSGTHKVLFAGHNLAPGIYFCRLKTGTFELTEQLILLR